MVGLMAAVTSAAFATTAEAAGEALVGAQMHWERNNTTDGRVAGPVNFQTDTTINSVDRDGISFTVNSTVTHVGGGVALHMVTHVRAAFAKVAITRQGNPAESIRLECKDGSQCIAWSVEAYLNENPNVTAPTGGMELGSNLGLTADPAALNRVYAQLCTLAECKN
jgi:hypothetical protein